MPSISLTSDIARLSKSRLSSLRISQADYSNAVLEYVSHYHEIWEEEEAALIEIAGEDGDEFDAFRSMLDL